MIALRDFKGLRRKRPFSISRWAHFPGIHHEGLRKITALFAMT
jgi:hypothetical protein